MGGNAFKNTVRVKREDIPSIITDIVSALEFPGLTEEYAMDSLMGSCGKKETSGDIDIAMNTYSARSFFEKEEPVFDLYEFIENLKEKLPRNRLFLETSNMGNVMTAWPYKEGVVQCDFIFGKKEWLQFSHYSPAENESSFKGVFLTQSFGILAKMNTDYETDVAKVGLVLSLENGLMKRWRMIKYKGQGVKEVETEYFETKYSNLPRFNRIGTVDTPDDAIRIIFGEKVDFSSINTFEKIVSFLKNKTSMYEIFQEKFLDNFKRHNAMQEVISYEELEKFFKEMT